MFRKRLRILLAVFFVVWCVLVGRLAQLQVWQGDYYRRVSADLRTEVRTIDSRRGSVTDRNGRLLAVDAPTFDIMVTLSEFPVTTDEASAIVRKLALETDTPEGDIYQELGRCRAEVDRQTAEERDRGVAKYVRRVLSNQPRLLVQGVSSRAAFMVALDPRFYRGLGVSRGFRRRYPQGEKTCHILGYLGRMGIDDIVDILCSSQHVSRQEADEILQNTSWSLRADILEDVGYKINDLVGRGGVERYYEEGLRGKRGRQWVERDRWGRIQKAHDCDPEPRPGVDLRLTIDAGLQHDVVQLLGRNVGAVVVMEIDSGEILALTSYPVFDPEAMLPGGDRAHVRQIVQDARAPLLSRAVSSAYPMGSVFKIVAAAVAIEENVVPESVECRGYLHSPDSFRCWKSGGHGPIVLYDAIVQSCNVFFYVLGERLCELRAGETECSLARWAMRLGIGESTGVDLSAENSGLLPTRQWKADYGPRIGLGTSWTRGDSRNLAVGQGTLLVTPLQAARVMAAVASGGRLPTPHVLKGRAVRPQSLPFAPSTTTELRAAMRNVVASPRGTGYSYVRSPLVDIAGKTGTAQTTVRAGPGDATLNHAWFVGYAPAEKPRVVVAVIMEYVPGHAGEEAGPVARGVFEATARMLGFAASEQNLPPQDGAEVPQ